MNEFFTIGHYAQCVTKASYDAVLNELTTDIFKKVVSLAPAECPYTKESDKDNYKLWKSENLPIVYFTSSKKRPNPKENTVFASGYAVIDIDNKPGVRYESSHPAVCCINYTGSGTHIFIHTDKWGLNQQKWQDTYNSIAYEIWCELCNKYKDHIRFDGRCSTYWYGCYLWNTEWIGNERFDRHWVPEERYLDDNTIQEMYDTSSYIRQEAGEYTSLGKKSKRRNEFIDNEKTITKIAENSKHNEISQYILKDFKELSYKEFLDKHEDRYTIIKGTTPVFTPFTDYNGSVYDMYETKGQMVVLWQPYMKKRDKDGNIDFVTKQGGRRASLFSHLKQLCQFTADKIDPDYILYDAVNWIYYYCENGHSFPKTEIISTVTGAMKSYNNYSSTLHIDHRMFVTGQTTTNPDTGEVTYMNTSEKISANAKCRKTMRIIKTVENWDPNLSFEDNIERIHTLDCESNYKIDKLSKKTLKDYIILAKSIPELVSKHKWLQDIEITKNTKKDNGKKGGHKTKQITVKNIASGETITFESCKQCMETLNINNRKRFSKFIKGTSNLNKIYEIIQR